MLQYFESLDSSGAPTSFVSRVENSSKAFSAKKCEMIPIEWVTMRLATGGFFLKRYSNVREGLRFAPVKLKLSTRMTQIRIHFGHLNGMKN